MPRTPVAGVARTVTITLKVTPREADQANTQATLMGFADRSAYIRWLLKRDGSKIERRGQS